MRKLCQEITPEMVSQRDLDVLGDLPAILPRDIFEYPADQVPAGVLYLIDDRVTQSGQRIARLSPLPG